MALYKLTDHFRIRNALNFINEYKFDFGSSTTVGTTSALPNQLYVGIGRNRGFDSNVSSDLIKDTANDVIDYRNNIRSLILVDNSDVDLGIARYDWDDFKNGNVIFNKRDTAFTHSYYTAVAATTQFIPFYCVNSNNNISNSLSRLESFQVFELTNLALHGSPSTIIQESDRPRVPNGSSFGTKFTDSNGNEWTFVYQLTSYQMDAVKNSNFLPVSYVYDYVNSNSITLAEQVMRQLGSMFVIITCRFNTDMIPTTELFSVEQAGLIANPLGVTGTRLTNKHYDVQGVDAATIDMNSGMILYVENKPSIFRQLNQEEKIQIILEY